MRKPLKRWPPPRMSLGQPPCCLVGDHYCFRGTGKQPELQPGQEPRGKGFPSLRRRELWLRPGQLGKLSLRFHSFPRREGAGAGRRPSPAPQLVLGPHLRQPGGPRVRREAIPAPSASPAGSEPSPKIKKYFGELKSAQGGDGLGGAAAGARQRTLWSLIKVVLSPRPSSSSESDGHSCQASGGSPL